MRRTFATCLLALALVGGASACSDDDPAAAPTTTSTEAVDPDLQALALAAPDLPAGFEPSDDVDDTITSFCANEDAAAGLRASARVVRGFTRSSGGASVIQLAFRFEDDGAPAFVAQAGAILERCNAVPDATGLAFEYEALAPELTAIVAEATDAHAGRYGTSVGSGNLTVELVAFHRGDVAQLVAVLGLGQPRAELDALAGAAFQAVLSKP